MSVEWIEIGNCRIACGDCLEILPTLEAGSVDITISSPPYNMIPKTKPSGIYAERCRKLNKGYESHADDLPQIDYEEWVRNVFQMCRDKTVGLMWINHKCKYVNKQARHPARIFPWEIHSEIIWDRCGSLTLNANRYAPSHEVVLAFGCPHFWDRVNDTKMTVWRIAPETKIDGHPCPYPLEIPSLW